MFEQTLCLAQGITEQYGGFSFRFVLGPPLVDVVEDLLLRSPLKGRQSKGTFCDEGVALYQFEGRGETVVLDFVIPRKDPNLPFVLYPYLGRTHNMSGWVQTELYIVQAEGLAPILTGNVHIA